MLKKTIGATKKILDKLRGLGVQVQFSSGRNLSIRENVRLDLHNICFGDNVQIWSNVHIFGSGELILGNNVVIGDGTIICVAERIVIEDDTMVAAQCYILDCNHGMHLGRPMRTQPMSIKPVHIGKDVWLGCGCAILAGADIGDGCVIAAHSVVDMFVEPAKIFVPDRNYQLRDRK